MSIGGSKVLRFPRTIRASEEPRGPEIGDVVADGRYALIECLGEGGLGTVFLADDRMTHQRVAIKTLVARYIGRREREQRLFDELRYLERVKDRRHVVAAIECGRLAEFGGWPFVVMEHVDGMSLFRHMLQGKRLAPTEIIEIGRQTARGILAIHHARVVHRDITPQNLLLLHDGRRMTVKIIDFSHGADADAPRLNAGEHGRLTGMHEVPGTAQYMPPEQANAKSADPRMDIYSFGIVLHEMIVGRNPFAGMSRDLYIDLQRQDALQVDPLDPRVYPDLPESLLRLLDRCLREDPAGRPTIELVVRRFEAMHGEEERLEGERFEAERTQPRLVWSVVEPSAEERGDALEVDPPVVELGPVDSDLVVEAETELDAEAALVFETAAVLDVVVVADGVKADDDEAANGEEEPSRRSPWVLVGAAAATVLLVAASLWAWKLGVGDERPPVPGVPQVLTAPAVEERVDMRPEHDLLPESVSHPAEGPRDDGAANQELGPAVVEAPRSPEPRRQRRSMSAAKAKPRCGGVVEAARAARTQREWNAVVKLTGEESCWSDAVVERLAWRVEALSELGRWEECAKLGDQANGSQIRARTNRCSARLGSQEDTP